jgi:hypothetical protein
MIMTTEKQKKIIATFRCALCDIMEDAGGIATRIKEAEEDFAACDWDDVFAWFKSIEHAAENSAILAAKMDYME